MSEIQKNPVRHMLPHFIKINDVDIIIKDIDEIFEPGQTIKIKFLHRFVHLGTSVLERQEQINSVGDVYPDDLVIETHKNWYKTHPQDEQKFINVELS